VSNSATQDFLHKGNDLTVDGHGGGFGTYFSYPPVTHSVRDTLLLVKSNNWRARGKTVRLCIHYTPLRRLCLLKTSCLHIN